MSKLQQVLNRCGCGVYLEVNRHRDYYQTAEDALIEKQRYECPPEIDEDVREVMVKTNTIIELQFYPDTPIGSYSLYHYDLEKILDEALEILKVNTPTEDR